MVNSRNSHEYKKIVLSLTIAGIITGLISTHVSAIKRGHEDTPERQEPAVVKKRKFREPTTKKNHSWLIRALLMFFPMK